MSCLRDLWRAFWRETENASRKDCLAPAPNALWQRRAVKLGHFFSKLFIGKIEISGKENLNKVPMDSAYILAPNHSHFADLFVLPEVLNGQPTRYMAARGVMSAFCGLLGLLLSKMGAFAASARAGIELLCAGQSMVIFPEGWTYLDGVMGRCHQGVVRICKMSAKRSNKTCYIVPCYFRYGKYPGSWIRRLPIVCQYLVLTLALPYYRRGLRIVIGEAIASADLPDKEEQAVNLLAASIARLDPNLQHG
jgi:1-acyl-sn-glycerol-3-phosphate acyltransferase